MSQLIQERHVEWTSPAALWDGFNGATDAGQRRIFRTPAILRFASDSFMQDFLQLMQVEPQRLAECLALPEKWTNPQADVVPAAPVSGLRLRLAQARNTVVRRLEARKGIVRTTAWNAAPPQQPLKLYHPAHQRYYLVAACLVCRTMGLPDRPLNTGAQERATFVLRLLRPRAGAAAVNPDPLQCDELAFVGGEWQNVADPTRLQPGEEQNPLSPLTYVERDGRKRRLLNGFIPVGKRDALCSARKPSAVSGTPPPPPLDTRRMQLKQQVLGPWNELEELAKRALVAANYEPKLGGSDPGSGPKDAAIQRANEQIRMIAWYVLLDLSHWLEANAPAVWTASQPGGSPAALQANELALYNKLGALSSAGQTLRQAVVQIRSFETALEGATHIFREGNPGWPSVAFQFVTATLGGPTGLTGTATRGGLEDACAAALAAPAGGLPAPPSPNITRLATVPFDSPWLTIRCVLERPSCAALSEPVVSDPTAAFQLAAFFDPDAPGRPISIGMPADTTPAGLRKFDRNTAFVLSDVLCGQVSSLRSLSFLDLVLAVLPFPLHKDLGGGDPAPCSESGGGVGMVCSFSLPIITICALILLMIMVKLFDLVLYWMPFFQICLPLPKKEGT